MPLSENAKRNTAGRSPVQFSLREWETIWKAVKKQAYFAKLEADEKQPEAEQIERYYGILLDKLGTHGAEPAIRGVFPADR